jgi:hypothetical protein
MSRFGSGQALEDAIVRNLVTLLTAAAATLGAAQTAGAQTAQPAMPAWDTHFSVGMISNPARDEGDDSDRSSLHAEGRLDVGRYWTQHLKTELGLSFLNRFEDFDYETMPVPGVRGGVYSYVTRSMRMMALTPTFTYQFLENQWVHPYLSSGARVGILETHSTRLPQAFGAGGIPYPVEALDRTDTRVFVRPFVAAGAKSYFSQHVFARTEGQALFDASGNSHISLRIGVGLDF